MDEDDCYSDYQDLKKTVYVSGCAYFFGFTQDKKFHGCIVQNERIHPDELSQKLPSISQSGPLFIECRNYFSFPNHQKGMLIGFLMPNSANWNFGIIHKVFPDKLYMQVHVLRDQSMIFNAPDANYQNKVYPPFFPLSWEVLNGPTHSINQEMQLYKTLIVNEQGELVPGMAVWPPPNPEMYNISNQSPLIEWQRHFELKSYNMFDFGTFRYLNQVNGRLPKIHKSGMDSIHNTNANDFCFEQSVHGADILRVPQDIEIEPLDENLPRYNFFIPTTDWMLVPKRLESNSKSRRTRNQHVTIPPYFWEPGHVVIDQIIDTVVYVLECIDRNLKHPIDEVSFHVPFPSDYLHKHNNYVYLQRFATISKSNLPQLHELEGCQTEEFEIGLEYLSLHTFHLPCFIEGDKGLSFHVLNKTEYDAALQSGQFELIKSKLADSDDVTNSLYDLLYGSITPCPVYKMPGIRVSTWIVDRMVHEGRVTPEFVDLCIACVGIGYGSRHCCATLGLNLYFGKRVSGMCNPTPVEGPDSATECEYYRSSFKNIQIFPILHNIWHRLRKKAFYLQEKMDYYLVKVLTSIKCSKSKSNDIDFHHRSPCRIGIITSGNHSVLGFANEAHMDTGDNLGDEVIESLLKEITDSYIDILASEDSILKGTLARSRTIIDYIYKIKDTIGISVPTTCAYQHVIIKQDIQLLQFFVMHGLGSCVFLHDFISHNFYAQSFLHNTSVCVGVDAENQVWLNNHSEKRGYVFAWGGSTPD